MTSVIFMHCAEKFILVLHKLHFFRHTFSKCIYKTASVCNLSIKKLFLFASNSLEGHVLQFVGSNADQHFQCVCFA